MMGAPRSLRSCNGTVVRHLAPSWLLLYILPCTIEIRESIELETDIRSATDAFIDLATDERTFSAELIPAPRLNILRFYIRSP